MPRAQGRPSCSAAEGDGRMSIVKNEAKNKNPVIAAVREQLEHRATWLYLLCDDR